MTNDEYFTPAPTINDLQKEIAKLNVAVDYLFGWTGAELPDKPKPTTAQPPYKGQSFVRALANFYDAAVTVSHEFEKLNDEEVYLDDPTGSYPFMDSFEDVVHAIGKWVEATDQELKANYPAERKPE